MAFSINLAIITGNVTRDPELKYTPSGSAVTTFGVATNHSVKKGDVWEDRPTFHNIVVWGKIAEYLTNTLKKGMKVSISGRIENRVYDKKDGTKGNISEIVADTVIPFSDHKSAPSENSPVESKPQTQQIPDVVEDIVIPDEMPF